MCIRDRLLGEARLRCVRTENVDILQGVAGGLDAGDVDRLDLADVAENGVQLPGEAVQLTVGQGESREAREVRNLVSGDL